MAQTKCINANLVKANGAMTIAQGGNIPSSNLIQDFSLAEINSVNKSVYGSHVTLGSSVASSGNLGTAKIIAAAKFSYQAPGKYIIPQVSTFIAGIASTLLVSPSSKISNRPNNKLGAVHTAHMTALSWTAGISAPVYTPTISSQAPSFGADREATTIGQFCYMTGKKLPVQADYTTPNSI